jgi:hypothetical protein
VPAASGESFSTFDYAAVGVGVGFVVVSSVAVFAFRRVRRS